MDFFLWFVSGSTCIPPPKYKLDLIQPHFFSKSRFRRCVYLHNFGLDIFSLLADFEPATVQKFPISKFSIFLGEG